MNLKKDRFNQLIKEFKIRELFNELGWDNVKKKETILIEEMQYELDAVAEKRNFLIFVCSADSMGKIPNQNIRRKIDNKISKLYFEHLIIYHDSNNSHQLWQLVIREQGKPISLRETSYFASQEPEYLFQKLRGLFISIDDEDKISLVDVKSNVQEQFNTNAEKVTKKFYERFQKELITFQKFIEGLEEKVDKEWYASLMLNRLMFIYFIQKKGFLDNNINYLSDKLKFTKKNKGKDKFYSFYRNFLLVLFHEGLGSPDHSEKLQKELGRIPYLNGGLFEVHQIEESNKKIDIADKAFERIFEFFDEYNWHLDNRPTATGKDINPDVIGYIFEKYINDRAAMGAYYTKEDITEYISKNTIIPFLFDRVKKECANAFRPDSSLWKMLKENPDRYIYDAVKHGVKLNEEDYKNNISIEDPKNPLWKDLPDDIKTGFDPVLKDKIVVDDDTPHLWELRKPWNKSAPEEIALPTETYREVIERRKRYYEIRNKISDGSITEINDFITYNLNIRQLAQDAVEQYEGSDFINAFYKAIEKISILDPTCGSGAFLFAALNILEPLYEACINRMREFIEQDDLVGGKKYQNFRKVIEEIKNHPNEKYYIFKSIILKNLYGVDIMKEATEIAKLRLFLKLVAEVDVDYKKDNLGLEPLPDIDFNIRAGNTLVGFAKTEDVDKSVEGSFDETFLKDEIKKIKEEAELVSMAFQRYKDAQLIVDKNNEQHITAKQELNNRLKSLNDKLNIYQARLYGIDPKKKKEYETWKSSHLPFHWFAEFYEIINCGGFDVVIGNPPYVVYAKKDFNYRVINFSTSSCNDLYAYIIERCVQVTKPNSTMGMIVPISIVSTDGFDSLRKVLYESMDTLFFSSYSMRPAKLFDGVEKHLTIYLAIRKWEKNIYTSKYFRWYVEERTSLFQNLVYTNTDERILHNGSIPKVGNFCSTNILSKLKSDQSISLYTVKSSSYKIYHTRKLRYFLQFLDRAPEIYQENGDIRETSELKVIYFESEEQKLIALSAYLSTLFFWYYVAYSDCRNLNKREVATFPISLARLDKFCKNELVNQGKLLLKNLQKNSYYQDAFYKSYGQLRMQVFQPRLSKNLVDEIDIVLAKHYGFTEEELDFIINYDIKYRMGKELEEE